MQGGNYSYTPNSVRSRRHTRKNNPHRVVLICGIIALVLITGVQLLYNDKQAVPAARFGDERVGRLLASDIQTKVDKQFEKASVRFAAGSRHVDYRLGEIGLENDGRRTAEQATRYPMWARLLPLSLMWYQPQERYFATNLKNGTAEKISQDVGTKLSYEPVDASFKLQNDTLEFISAQNGHTITKDAVLKAVRDSHYTPNRTTIQPASQTSKPGISNDDFKKVKAQAEKAIAAPITLTAPGKPPVTVHKGTIASWLTIEKTDTPGKVNLGIDKDAVTAYAANTLNKAVAKSATITKVQLRDGAETGRTAGTPGTSVSVDDLMKKLDAIIHDDAGRTVAVSFVPVASPIEYARSYSPTQAGLQAYVTYITTEKDVHIALQQLDGAGMSARGRAADSVVSASTYKLYIAMMLFSRIDEGKVKWSDQMQGTTVRTCFDQMIVQSMNNCAEDWIKQFGGGAGVNQFLYGKGLSTATTFTASDATHTSANDLLKTLIGLNDSTLYKGENRTILLNDMAKQIYRNGVPAGSSGDVQDKVGFLWDYNHDAAIVHTTKGSYAVTILTKGMSFGDIAAITRQLEAIMYP